MRRVRFGERAVWCAHRRGTSNRPDGAMSSARVPIGRTRRPVCCGRPPTVSSFADGWLSGRASKLRQVTTRLSVHSSRLGGEHDTLCKRASEGARVDRCARQRDKSRMEFGAFTSAGGTLASPTRMVAHARGTIGSLRAQVVSARGALRSTLETLGWSTRQCHLRHPTRSRRRSDRFALQCRPLVSADGTVTSASRHAAPITGAKWSRHAVKSSRRRAKSSRHVAKSAPHFANCGETYEARVQPRYPITSRGCAGDAHTDSFRDSEPAERGVLLRAVGDRYRGDAVRDTGRTQEHDWDTTSADHLVGYAPEEQSRDATSVYGHHDDIARMLSSVTDDAVGGAGIHDRVGHHIELMLVAHATRDVVQALLRTRRNSRGSCLIDDRVGIRARSGDVRAEQRYGRHDVQESERRVTCPSEIRRRADGFEREGRVVQGHQHMFNERGTARRGRDASTGRKTSTGTVE